MSDNDQMKLRRLDLTTLLVFDGLMRARKATRVAADLGLSQSSVSHALRRLRGVFGDELFLRRPHGLEPTAIANAMEAPIRSALDELRGALAGPAPFAPATSAAVLRIGAHDYEQATLIPPLLRKLQKQAPTMRVIARALVRREALSALGAAELDLALGYFWRLPEECASAPLYTETYAVVGASRNPLMNQRLTLKRYAGARHVVVSPAGDLSGIVDAALAREGLKREVVAAVPMFFPALAIAAESDAIVTLPRRFAEKFSRRFGLALAPAPLPIRSFEVSAVRHRRNARNAMLDWIVGLLQESAS